MSNIVQILRNNHKKKVSGLGVSDKINKEVIAVVEKIGNKKKKYVFSDENSDVYAMSSDPNNFLFYPHVPLGKERFNILVTGESGMGKSSIVSILVQQTYALITKNIFYVCGTDIKIDRSLAPLKYIQQIPGDAITELNVENFQDSLVVFDDIDNCEFHKEAIKLLNKLVECGRKFNINVIYVSHIHSKLNESKIYQETDMYITNVATNNRMFEHNLNVNKKHIEEIENFLKSDCFVCYNKFHNSIITDRRVYKLI